MQSLGAIEGADSTGEVTERKQMRNQSVGLKADEGEGDKMVQCGCIWIIERNVKEEERESRVRDCYQSYVKRESRRKVQSCMLHRIKTHACPLLCHFICPV